MKSVDIPITMTSKGTFTLPARVRKDFGLNTKGDKLMLRFTPGSRSAELKAPMDLKAMQAEIAALIPADITPFDLAAIRQQKHASYLDEHHDSIA